MNMARHGGEVEDAVVVEKPKASKSSLWLPVIVVAIFAALLLAIFWTSKNPSKAVAVAVAVAAPVIQKSVGMELRGCGQNDAWLKNTNPCDVLVRHVQRSSSPDNFGERTDWMREIKAGDSVRVNVGITSSPIYTSYSLYISNTAGGQVGFISGDCPPPKSKK